MVDQLVGFPRHLSQHVGGMVITHSPLCELVPIENAAMADRTVIQWNKDDLDELGILKIDCLSLGMLTAIRKCFALVKQHHGRDLTLANIPADEVCEIQAALLIFRRMSCHGEGKLSEVVLMPPDERVRFLRTKVAMPNSGFRTDQVGELIRAFELLVGRPQS